MILNNTLEKTMTTSTSQIDSKTQRKFIISIEAIRGFAALYVTLGHIVLVFKPYIFFPKYKFLIKALFGYGNQAVILFFIVSGFSIHYSSCHLDFKNGDCLHYIYKRIRRIYPIFVLSLIFSILILNLTSREANPTTILLSFLFLTDIANGAISHPIPTNPPIWSLSYEVFYYLLYPLISSKLVSYKSRIVISFSFLLALTCSFASIWGFSNHLTNIMELYWIWIFGAIIAQKKIEGDPITFPFSKGWIFASFLFAVTLENAYCYTNWAWGIAFILLFLLFLDKPNSKKISPSIENTISFLIIVLSVFICLTLSYYAEIVVHKKLIRGLLLSMIPMSLIFLLITEGQIKKSLRHVLNLFTRFGRCSYALYIIHWPLLAYFHHKTRTLITESISYMILYIISYLVSTLLIAWVVEVKVQPYISHLIDSIYYRKNTSY